ncbi:MAG TPA: hypothetical protein VN328_03710 [Thermodesulfovibrionales bacterium]|nr:hypothetical protein [Thermodesulfovibrionales bacterium]
MKRCNVLLFFGVLMLSVSAVLTGCGGGGSSTSRSGGPDATLTEVKAKDVVGDSVIQAVKLIAPATALGEVKASSVSPEKRSPLMSIFEKVAPVVGKRATTEKQSSAISSEPCPGGGSIEVKSISGVDLSGNVKADVSVNGCKIGSETMNGTLKVTVPFTAVADIQHVKEFTIEVSSFTYSDSNTNLSLTDNFTMVADNITYSGDSLTGGSLTLGGTVSGTLDGSPINIGCDSLAFQFSANTAGVTVSVSGRMRATCLGGWATLSTNRAVFVPAHASCPTDGEIVVSAGGNSIKVRVEPSSKITVFFNGSLVQTYDNCSKLTGFCKG